MSEERLCITCRFCQLPANASTLDDVLLHTAATCTNRRTNLVTRSKVTGLEMRMTRPCSFARSAEPCDRDGKLWEAR